MKLKKFVVVLTNGEVGHIHEIKAINSKDAIVLAQAEAIGNGTGYEYQTITEVKENPKDKLTFLDILSVIFYKSNILHGKILIQIAPML